MDLESQDLDSSLNRTVYNPYILKAVLAQKGLNMTRIAYSYTCQTLYDLLSLDAYSVNNNKVRSNLLHLQETIWSNIEEIQRLSALFYEAVSYPQIIKGNRNKTTLSEQLYEAYKQMLKRLQDIYSYFRDNKPLALYVKRLSLILDDRLLKAERDRTIYLLTWQRFGIDFNYHKAFSQGIFTPKIRVDDSLIRRIKRKYGKELSDESYQEILVNEPYPYLILYLYEIDLPFKQRVRLKYETQKTRKVEVSYTEVVTSHIQSLKVFTIEELKSSLASDGYNDIPHSKLIYITNQISTKSPSITPHEYVYLRYEEEYHKLYWQAKESYLDLSKWVVLESIRFLKTIPNNRATYTEISLHLYKNVDSIKERPGLEYMIEYIQAYMVGSFDDLFRYVNGKQIELTAFVLSLSDIDTKSIVYRTKAHHIYKLIAKEVYQCLKESYTQEMSLTRLKKACTPIYSNISSILIHRAVNYFLSNEYYRYTKDEKVIYGLVNPYIDKQLYPMFCNMERNIDKVIAFVRVLDISISSFCRLVDISESYLSRCQKEGNDLSEKTIHKIQTLFPELSKMWFQDKKASIINPYATTTMKSKYDTSTYPSNYKVNIDDFEEIEDYHLAQEYLNNKKPSNGKKLIFILGYQYEVLSLDIEADYDESKLSIDSHVVIAMDLMINQELMPCLLDSSIIDDITIVCKNKSGCEVYSYHLINSRLYSMNINRERIENSYIELSIRSDRVKMKRI